MVKIVVVAPMPRPSVKIATAANPGLRRSVRHAYDRSCTRIPMVIYSGTMRRAARDVTNRVTGAAGHLGIDLAEYDTRIRTFIPKYEMMLAVVAETLRATVHKRAPLIVDLGIGTGSLASRCLEAVPAARVVGVDEDAGMLAAARERLGTRLTRTLHGSFESTVLPRCDACIATLSLHHIPTRARRLRLFRRLHRALRSGGILIS